MPDSSVSDVCTDCGRVFEAKQLFRCGRTRDGEWSEIRLCIDCLYAANPHMQRDLIEAAYA
jgi:hypothetical protein